MVHLLLDDQSAVTAVGDSVNIDDVGSAPVGSTSAASSLLASRALLFDFGMARLPRAAFSVNTKVASTVYSPPSVGFPHFQLAGCI